MSVIRKTKSIKLLLDAFDQVNDAMSVVELVNRFNGKMDKTTVYRVLDRLEDQGTLHSFVGRDGSKRYAKWERAIIDSKEIKIHPHFECRYCGVSSCLPFKISIPSIPNMIIESAEQLLIGKCSNCLS
jgi:Fur family ferric uptake transcriptional regulator